MVLKFYHISSHKTKKTLENSIFDQYVVLKTLIKLPATLIIKLEIDTVRHSQEKKAQLFPDPGDGLPK